MRGAPVHSSLLIILGSVSGEEKLKGLYCAHFRACTFKTFSKTNKKNTKITYLALCLHPPIKSFKFSLASTLFVLSYVFDEVETWWLSEEQTPSWGRHH